jgi:hypothetical protein
VRALLCSLVAAKSVHQPLVRHLLVQVYMQETSMLLLN